MIVFDDPVEMPARGWDDGRNRVWLVRCYPFGDERAERWFNVDPVAWKGSEAYRETIKREVRRLFEEQFRG